MNAQQTNKQGFTIIEVVLVLAIAALIFLMIFIALPALQRGQRDTARKNDASTVAAALNNYRSANRGSLTGLSNTNLQAYIDSLNQYETSGVELSTGTGTLTPTENQVLVRTGAKCPTTATAPNTALTPVAGSARNAIVVVRLENNGQANGWLLHCVET